MKSIDEKWIAYFKDHGYPQTTGIAAGMESVVYSLIPGELIAKVWDISRSEEELRLLQTFYEKLGLFAVDMRTPEFVDLEIVNGTPVSKERFLPGQPLQERLREDARHADKNAITATVKVLDFLRSINAFPEGQLLYALDDSVEFWYNATTWSEAIQTLISRRIARFGHQLCSDIPDLDNVVRAINNFLNTRNNVSLSVIHGDLCGANILVDTDCRPLSVLDFGFLSTIGDPAFDASISSAIYNMYGPRARDIEEEITNDFISAFGYEREVLQAYKAVYAIITSNAYAPDGSDGHYRWCVAMLRRKDVRSSLGL